MRVEFVHFRLSLLSGVAVLAGAALPIVQPALAAPVSQTITDYYYGGMDYYADGGYPNPSPSPQSADVIGDASIFQVTDAVISYDPTGQGTLTVKIDTNFAGQPGSSGADGTVYGSLLLGPANNGSTWQANHPSAPPATQTYSQDVYHPGEWTYAFVADGNANSTGGSQTNSSGGVYAIGATQTAVVNSGSYGNSVDGQHNTGNVPESYKTYTGGSGGTYDGEVVMSNVGGNPISYPNSGAPGFWFRQGQAVSFTPATNESATVSGTMTVDAGTGYILYTIDDYDLLDLGNDIAMSWAMTCANDIIQGAVDLPITITGGSSPTPLPGTLPLFVAGLGILAFAGFPRRKNSETASAAA